MIFCKDAARETSELRTHHDPSGHPVCNYTMRVMQAAARELMRDQTSGGFFYTTINKLKKKTTENALRASREQTCSEGLGSICICPCVAEHGFLCVSRRFSFPRPSSSLSAPGSCPLRRGYCGTRPGADEAGAREMSTSREESARHEFFLTSPARKGPRGGRGRGEGGVVVYLISASAQRTRGLLNKQAFDCITQHAARNSCQRLCDLPWRRWKNAV